ncbi:restriction endonuclease subunit S [Bacillus anthracis]|nr:restriction endonuclease subunit S [Bacillus anthracis]
MEGNLKEETFKSLEWEKARPYLLQKGDILLARSGATVGKAYIHEEDISACFAGYLIKLKVDSKKVYPKFLYYYTQTKEYADWISENTIQATIENVSAEKYANLEMPLPSLFEQQIIISFLNKETKNINEIVRQKERLMALLEEKRQSIITEAVTKGLNPNVKMKHSGVEWIGEIPEHWTIKKIKHISTFVGSGKTPKGGSEIYPESGVLFLRSMNVHYDGIRLKNIVHITPEIDEDMRSTRVKSKDVLLNITGASIGRSCIVPESLGKANVNQHVCIIRGNTRVVVPELLSKIMSSNFIMQQILMSQNGSSREGLNFTQVKNLEFPLTRDFHEQIEIANHISVETDKVNSLISMIKQQIKKLKDYRQSLIYEAVTGKIDVRDFEIESE